MPHLHIVIGDRELAHATPTEAGMEQFELVTRGGKALGPVKLARPEWPVGAIIDGYAGKLRVVEVVAGANPDGSSVLIVEPA
jgi:hypothetical protein